jgi:hypothetical protein
VQRLKQALKDAGFYKGAVNNQMGPDGVTALKAAKAELKLGGAPDVAGDFTIQKLKQYAKTRGGMDLMKELSSPDSTMSVAIGMAEGTRTLSGGKTTAAAGAAQQGGGHAPPAGGW